MNFEQAAEIFDLKDNEFFSDIKKKYRKLVLICHPDRYQNEPAKKRAEKRLKEVNEAYRYFSDNYNECFDENGKNKRSAQYDAEFNEEVLKRLRDIANSLAQFNDDSFGDYNEDFDSDEEEMDDREFFRKYYPEVDDKEFFEHYASSEYREKYSKQYSYEIKEPQRYSYSGKPNKEYTVNNEPIFSSEKIKYYWEQTKRFYNIAVVIISLIIIVYRLIFL